MSAAIRAARRDPLRAMAIAGALLFLILAVIGPFIVPHNPIIPNPSDRLAAPSLAHPMGTDHLGRDVLSRIIAATRLSVGLA
ncbi:MAG: ABC transporter permease, partial [Pseudomonadota bacterium]